MEKFIPYDKLSKKKRRELDAAKRGGWGAVSPVTRKSVNPKAYNRQKARKWSDESFSVPFVFSSSALTATPYRYAQFRLLPTALCQPASSC